MPDKYQVIADNINKIKGSKIAEVGVWKGSLTKYLLNSCKTIKNYYMIDPLIVAVNEFEYCGNDLPSMMKDNIYSCRMGGEKRTQIELDSIAAKHEKLSSIDPRVSFIREKSEIAYKEFEDNYFDTVFIDAIHLYENVKRDINCWLPKVKKGGLLMGDDYSNQFPGVMKAVDEILPDRIIKKKVWIWKNQ